MRNAKSPRRAARIPSRELIAMLGQGGRPLRERHAADGRRQAIARRFRPPAIGQHRPAGAHVQGQHGEEFVRAQEHGEDSRLPDARAESRNPVPRLRRRRPRRDGQLPGPVARAGGRAAVEFARRAHALAAGHSAATWAGAQARPARAVDALPHLRRVHRGGRAARSVRALSGRSRGRAPPCSKPATAR